jgi:hypothetical protein
MKYFLDTEFHEGFHKPLFGRRRHFIDLISVGIVREDGASYYAISKDFDLKAVWNNPDTWVRENVLRKIHKELVKQQSVFAKTHYYRLFEEFSFKSMKNLICWHGKSNKEVATEILRFMGFYPTSVQQKITWKTADNDIRVYGYFADYDWVLFCSLFGRMIDLPKGMPFYCLDLKQMMYERGLSQEWKHEHCPDSANEHNALADARWNMKLYDEIIKAKS